MINRKTKLTRSVLSGLTFTGLDLLYQQLDDEVGVILTFHQVLPDTSEEFSPNAHLSIRPEFLETTIELLKHRGIDIVGLDEASDRLTGKQSGGRFAVLTFDDGYRNTLENAVPVMQRHAVPYTVYVATGLIEGQAFLWWEGIEHLVRQESHLSFQTENGEQSLDCSSLSNKQDSFERLLSHLTTDVPEVHQHQRAQELCANYNIDLAALTRQQIMTWEEVHLLMSDPLCTLGAHTVHHQAVARLTEEDARREIEQGAAALEDATGTRPRHFAYPYGYRSAVSDRDRKLALAAGFKTAVTTMPGMLFPEHRDHLTMLPRISVNGLYQKERYIRSLITGLPTRMMNRGNRVLFD